MRSRRVLVRVLIPACVFVAVVAIIIVVTDTGPGPDSPKYWLRLALAEAGQTGNFYIHQAIVGAYGELGDADGACKAAQTYIDNLRKSWLRSTISNILIKARLKKHVITVSSGPMIIPSSIWAHAAKAQAKAGDPVGAKVSAASIWPDAAKAQAKAGDPVAAIEHRLAIHTRSSAYCAVALAFAKAGDEDGFRKCINLAKADAAMFKTAGSESLDIEIAVTLARAGRIDEAAAIAANLNYDGTFRRIVRAVKEQGNIEGLRKCLEIVESADWNDAGYDRICVIGHLLGPLVKDGHVDEAMALVESSANAGLYLPVVKALADIGKMSRAIDITKTIRDDKYGWHRNAWDCIARAQARAGDIPRAKKTVLNIAYRSGRYRAYRSIARLQAEQGDRAGYEETIGLAAKAVDRRAHCDKASAYVELASDCAELGDMANFWKFIARARACADKIEDNNDYNKITSYLA